MNHSRVMGLFVGQTLMVMAGCRASDPSAGIGSSTGAQATEGDPTGMDTGMGGSMGAQASSGSDTGGDMTATGSDTSATGGDSGTVDFEPVLLDCPHPADLPFSTQTDAFATDEATAVVADNPRVKDQASDLLGVPDGVVAYTAIGNEMSPSADLHILTGAKARTAIDEGLTGTAIGGEWVSLWGYNGSSWAELARSQTDANGGYSFSDVDLGRNRFQPRYAILEGDGSCAPHYSFVLPEGAQVVVADIDGTLTSDDQELFTQISDGAYTPSEKMSAARLMATWADKGYTVVYLTARPHGFRTETRVWLDDLNYPPGPVITANNLVVDDSARQYKRTWVNRLTNDFGWRVVAAYGNATSDIDAYEDAGIPKNVTFIVGENAGVADTQPIENNDYTSHIADFVLGQPDADPI